MPAIDAPFPKVSLGGGRSALQIGSALAFFSFFFNKWTGMVPTHTPSIILPPHLAPYLPPILAWIARQACIPVDQHPGAGSHSGGFVLAERPREGPGQALAGCK